MRLRIRRRLSVAALMLIVCGIAVARLAAAVVSFQANLASLGAIPDYPASQTCHNPALLVPKDVTFPVGGMPGKVRSVGVSMTFSPQHAFVGDLSVTLMAPGGGPSHVIFARTGATTTAGAGDSSNLAGPYYFFDEAVTASGGWWQAATLAADGESIATALYRTTAPGGAGQVDPAPATSMDPVFAGLAPNGTWTLRITDGCNGNTGGISDAWLTLITNEAPADFEGNGASDWSVIRDTGPAGAVTWYLDNSQGFSAAAWGLSTDRYVPADYDYDGKADLAVWRGTGPSAFYVRRSSDLSLFATQFGVPTDNPAVVGDYDFDQKADPAVYRDGAQSVWYAWRSSDSTLFAQPFGTTLDTPAPGDYNADGRPDFAVRRTVGPGAGTFYILHNLGDFFGLPWGNPTDDVVPGDYNGDGRTDIAVVRNVGGVLHWYIRTTAFGTFMAFQFGAAATDLLTPGDYDNDGATDIAVWRRSATPGQCAFYVLTSSSGFTSLLVKQWGLMNDYPVANFNVHR
jgi:hypothetical protein